MFEKNCIYKISKNNDLKCGHLYKLKIEHCFYKINKYKNGFDVVKIYGKNSIFLPLKWNYKASLLDYRFLFWDALIEENICLFCFDNKIRVENIIDKL